MRAAAAVVAFALLSLPSAARAQTTTSLPPLEDVTLRGRVLSANGSPVANTPVRVDAVNDSGFAVVGFFFSAGFSTLACFTDDKSMCPAPNSKRFSSTTDANGNYSFTFHNAHRRGIQTDTDYVLSLGVRSATAPDKFVVASYELELQDAVHNAPDLKIWDPTVTIRPSTRAYRVAYKTRPVSKNGVQLLVGDKPLAVAVSEDRDIDARDVEDASFTVVAHAAKDITAAGTIYHQRFTAGPVAAKGALVPLSRGAACTATRSDGSAAHCGYTDGDLINPGVVDPNPCNFVADQPGCQLPVTKVTVDLGAPKEVGDVRTRCGCTLEASNDAQTWHNLPASGSFGAQQMRYVRVSGDSLAAIPEVSVWPPWPNSGDGIGLLPGARGGSGSGDGGNGAGVPFAIVLVAVALGVAAWALGRRRRNDVTEVGRPQ
jgi:hypothetical protein